MNMFARTNTSVMSFSWTDVNAWSFSYLGDTLKKVWRIGSSRLVSECDPFRSVWVTKTCTDLLYEYTSRPRGHEVIILYTGHDTTRTGQIIYGALNHEKFNNSNPSSFSFRLC
jgi:hypothetical protein